ncbi:MAG: damage-inducible protein DinB [Flavobacterium sp. MedPE-SWcel]|uniref:DinB family protein n=1 Tax=uncultured Flavobacterium sp. TaxID=165435 RepID=UPI000912FC1F|nr:DinB family protein [uncultured Flavobacterium sp.]OIQ15383.1 MAG: damage-inducible protein DinB [Flavobacterium sp. MedPE-SWcel]
MELINLLLQEFDKEKATTQKMLAQIPEDKFDWQPHEKSMKIKMLAAHIAELPEWITMTLHTDELDLGKEGYKPAEINDKKELMAFFEEKSAIGRSSLVAADVSTFDKEWILRTGDQIHSSDTKYEVIRMIYSQIVHHRAQLGVNLRLLDIAVPASYGPSADDMGM